MVAVEEEEALQGVGDDPRTTRQVLCKSGWDASSLLSEIGRCELVGCSKEQAFPTPSEYAT
jgi:hypothetical protein